MAKPRCSLRMICEPSTKCGTVYRSVAGATYVFSERSCSCPWKKHMDCISDTSAFASLQGIFQVLVQQSLAKRSPLDICFLFLSLSDWIDVSRWFLRSLLQTAVKWRWACSFEIWSKASFIWCVKYQSLRFKLSVEDFVVLASVLCLYHISHHISLHRSSTCLLILSVRVASKLLGESLRKVVLVETQSKRWRSQCLVLVGCPRQCWFCGGCHPWRIDPQ